MALAAGRRLTHQGRAYEWTVRERGDNLRLVVQDATTRGQFLIVSVSVFAVCERGESHGDFYVRNGFSRAHLGQHIDEAIARGWRPGEKGLPPFRMGDEAEEFPRPGGVDDISRGYVEDLGSVLRIVLRDLAWRERLTRAFGEVQRVPAEEIRAVDEDLAARVSSRGEVEVFLRVWNPKDGDVDPYLAARYSGCWPEVLKRASHWYPTAEPDTAAERPRD